MRGLLRRLLEVIRPQKLDRESIEELETHVEMLVARKREAGVAEADARRQARLELGSVASVRQELAEQRTGFPLEQLRRELWQAARALSATPGLTGISVATIGVGLGISTLLFALVNGIVLNPLRYPDPNRLVRVFDTNREAKVERSGVASGNVVDWRRDTTAFDGIAGYYAMGRTVTTDSQSEVVITAAVSADFFNVVGLPPLVGRTFTAEEVRRANFSNAAAPIGPDPVVILSHAFWRERFGGALDVIGKSLVLDRRPFTIVGVMPDGLALPEPGVRLWIPWNISDGDPRDQHYLGALARLSPGVTIEQAQDQLNVVASDLAAKYPVTNRGWSVQLSPLSVETTGEAANVLWVLLAAVGLVVVVACANVALLSLMRGLDRSDETAVRLALGASSSRLIREFLMESVLVAIAGGVCGLAVASGGLRLLPRLTTDLPRLDEVSLDGRVQLFIVAATLLTALLSGLPQAWRRTRSVSVLSLASASVRTTAGSGRHRMRDGIVVCQMALAVVLLAGSGLLVRSYLHLRSVDPGFDPRGVLVAPVFLDPQAYNSGDKTRTYYRTLFERLAAIPGVVAVGGATTVPTSPLGPDFERPVWPDGATADRAQEMPASVRVVTPGYFSAMKLRVADGRALDERDTAQGPRVIMVSETLARRLWPGESSVGRSLVVDYSTAGTYPYEIVGVVGDTRFRGPRSEPLAEIYIPHARASYLILNVVIRAAGDPRSCRSIRRSRRTACIRSKS
jgi:putative ABC transport system permease protein